MLLYITWLILLKSTFCQSQQGPPPGVQGDIPQGPPPGVQGGIPQGPPPGVQGGFPTGVGGFPAEGGFPGGLNISCVDVKPMENFNLHNYLGRWYEIQKYPNRFQTGDCTTADYGVFFNGSLSVANTEALSNEIRTVFGNAAVVGDQTVGQLRVSFPGQEPEFITELLKEQRRGNYNVIATDYVTYSIVYSCSQFDGEYAWVLSRTPVLPPFVILELEKWMEQRNLDISRFLKTNQLNCRRSLTT